MNRVNILKWYRFTFTILVLLKIQTFQIKPKKEYCMCWDYEIYLQVVNMDKLQIISYFNSVRKTNLYVMLTLTCKQVEPDSDL
jgi:hypothetical protein